MTQLDSDREFLGVALQEARIAASENEVPVGAVLVLENRIIAQDHNRVVQRKNPIAHAELLVLQTAIALHWEKWLLDSTLYVTLEPCSMCAGALVLARVKRLVFCTADPKAGACGSVYNIAHSEKLNHRIEIASADLYQEEASVLLTDFFQKLRGKRYNGVLE